ncbi:MAG: hypothetical protein ACTS8A_03850 [Arsenophonus sp. ET-LJ4-MAG3]
MSLHIPRHTIHYLKSTHSYCTIFCGPCCSAIMVDIPTANLLTVELF